MGVYDKLLKVQSELKAPKSQYNNFGKYAYRSCEDILESLKPLLAEVKAVVTLEDEITQIGDRIYVKAIATFTDIENAEKVAVSAYAREEENKKGMDGSQITGASSSYARKYALNGLFAIDDNKDSDTTNNHGKDKNKAETKEKNTDAGLSDAQVKRLYAIAYSAGISREKVKEQIQIRYKKDILQLTKNEYDIVCSGYEKLKKEA